VVRKATAQAVQILPASRSVARRCSNRAASPGRNRIEGRCAAWDADAADSCGALVQPHAPSADPTRLGVDVSSARSPICGVVAVGIRASSMWRIRSPYFRRQHPARFMFRQAGQSLGLTPR
jgi:hypothetical protein